MSAALPALLHVAGHLSRIGPARRFARAVQDPRRAQEAWLADFVRRNAGTEYGRAHGLAQATGPDEFRRRFPLMTPGDLEPWVRRLMQGERDLLTAEAPVYYAVTTGSSGEAKTIPITEAYREEFQQTVHVALYHLRRRFPAAFRGRALYFVGSRRLSIAPDGLDVGTMSGFNFSRMPPLVRAIYAWPEELFEVPTLPTRSFLALLLATVGDPSLVAGIFPAPIVYLLRDLETHADALARTLRDGVLPAWLELTTAQRAFFTARLGGPNRTCARRLERAGSAPEGERVRVAWPSLRLVYCWLNSSAGLYVPELRRRLGPDIAVRDAIYAACEGWCTVPIGDEEPGGALAITSHFYEFIEESAWLAGGRETRFGWELEDGRRYVIVVTNSAGLYRYVLGDVLEVCGFHGRTPRLKFVRKATATANLVGEKLDEGHVNEAVAEPLRRAGVDATYFTLAPVLGAELPGYVLFLEPRRTGSAEAFEAVRAGVESELRRLAFEYDRLRGFGQLAPVGFCELPAGTYDRMRQAKVRAGSAEAQLKIAHLVTDPESLPPELRAALRAAPRPAR